MIYHKLCCVAADALTATSGATLTCFSGSVTTVADDIATSRPPPSNTTRGTTSSKDHLRQSCWCMYAKFALPFRVFDN